MFERPLVIGNGAATLRHIVQSPRPEGVPSTASQYVIALHLGYVLPSQVQLQFPHFTCVYHRCPCVCHIFYKTPIEWISPEHTHPVAEGSSLLYALLYRFREDSRPITNLMFSTLPRRQESLCIYIMVRYLSSQLRHCIHMVFTYNFGFFNISSQLRMTIFPNNSPELTNALMIQDLSTILI